MINMKCLDIYMENNASENPVILDSEKLFGIAVNNYLNKNGGKWKILKSEYRFCYLDFILINLNNLYSVYLEYKERSYSYGYTHYDTFFISLRKYGAIKKNYNNCYIVWDFTHSTQNDEELYYIKYDKELLEKFIKDHNKSRLLIPSKCCKNGFENLMSEMIDAIPDWNLI